MLSLRSFLRGIVADVPFESSVRIRVLLALLPAVSSFVSVR